MIYQIPYEISKLIPEIKDKAIYRILYSDQPVKVSDIVRYLEWGTNALIKSGGVRIGVDGLVKKWRVLRDPHTMLGESTFVAKSKKTIIYLWFPNADKS